MTLTMRPAHSLEGRVAIVTGGGTGIGRATALVLAEHGADLVLAGRRVAPLEETAAEIEALGRRAVTAPTDVTDPEQCEQLVETAVAALSTVDILVNNAGGGWQHALMEWTPREWREIIALNLDSVWYMSRVAAQPMLAKGKGSIVNISSGASMLTMPTAAPYGAAKAGVNNLTGAMAAGLTPKGIRVNAIAVGAVHTDQTTEENMQYVGEGKVFPGNALGRVGRPDEIAYAVHFLASDASSFCSGQTIWINGGRKG